MNHECEKQPIANEKGGPIMGQTSKILTCRMERKPTCDPWLDRVVCSHCGHNTIVSVKEKEPHYCSECGARNIDSTELQPSKMKQILRILTQGW